jgi:hypothetical protein
MEQAVQAVPVTLVLTSTAIAGEAVGVVLVEGL